LYPLNILIVAQIPVAVSMGGVFPWREGFHFNTELSAAGIAAGKRREVGEQPSCSYGVRRRVPGISQE